MNFNDSLFMFVPFKDFNIFFSFSKSKQSVYVSLLAFLGGKAD